MPTSADRGASRRHPGRPGGPGGRPASSRCARPRATLRRRRWPSGPVRSGVGPRRTGPGGWRAHLAPAPRSHACRQRCRRWRTGARTGATPRRRVLRIFPRPAPATATLRRGTGWRCTPRPAGAWPAPRPSAPRRPAVRRRADRERARAPPHRREPAQPDRRPSSAAQRASRRPGGVRRRPTAAARTRVSPRCGSPPGDRSGPPLPRTGAARPGRRTGVLRSLPTGGGTRCTAAGRPVSRPARTSGCPPPRPFADPVRGARPPAGASRGARGRGLRRLVPAPPPHRIPAPAVRRRPVQQLRRSGRPARARPCVAHLRDGLSRPRSRRAGGAGLRGR